MAIELQRGDRLAPMIIHMLSTLDRIIPPALLDETAPACDQIGVKRETHLHKPRPLQNQPRPTTQTRKFRSGVPQFDKRRDQAGRDGNEEEIEVPILEPIWVLSLQVEDEEFLAEGEEGDEVEEGRGQGKKVGEIGEEGEHGVEEEEGGGGDRRQLEGGSDAIVVAGGVDGGDGGVEDAEEGEEEDCHGGYGREGFCSGSSYRFRCGCDCNVGRMRRRGKVEVCVGRDDGLPGAN